jgi:hypothetical protein
MFEELGKLPRLRETHLPELRAELARLEAEQATPELLDRQTKAPPTSDNATASQSSRTNTSGTRPLEFSPREIKANLKRIESLYPTEDFSFSSTALSDGIAIRNQFTNQLQQYRLQLIDPNYRFLVPSMLGLAADLTFVDEARLAHRLEAFSIAESLSRGFPNEAILPLRSMLQIDRCLAQVRHVVPRLNAVILRQEALQALAAICANPKTGHELRCQLLQLLNATLAAWPPDAQAWVGDRALGLHTYELVRRGSLLSILSPEEIGKLKIQGDTRAFASRVRANVDHDELFYLRAMREIITSCESSYADRVQVLAQIAEREQELDGTDKYPTFAAEFLLDEIAHGMRMQVLDRARCEAWRLALAVATDNPLPQDVTNPLTGQPFRVVRTDEEIVVDQIDDRQPGANVVVPLNQTSHEN